MPADPKPGVWGGRIAAALDPRAAALNDSLPVDRRLWPEELALSRGYARALLEAGVLDGDGADALDAACESLEADLRAGTVALAGEDVHAAVEAELTRRAGEAGRRLHTGRSRNDQVATLLRMHVMSLCDGAVERLRELQRALVGRARAAGDTIVAAQTHLQPAQPVRLAQLWLAHVAAFERDEARLLAAREAADRLPLGAGAVAGTPLHYDRVALAGRLGFSRVASNSVDAVGDRDFALEYLHAGAQVGVHLSRLAEDLVLWCSPGWGWFRPPDGFSTGSSLLPQKRNPDLFELARGKSGRLIANAQRLAIVLKGLPSAYQKDLQEDKEAVFDTADTLERLLDALPPAIAGLDPDPERMAASVTFDLLAVELADLLVAEGLAFRDAHALVGKLWARAEAEGKTADLLSESELKAVSPHFTAARLRALTPESAIARRDHPPGTGDTSIAAQLSDAEERLGWSAAARTRPEVAPASAASGPSPASPAPNAPVLRKARLEDVPAIATLIAQFVADGTLLPRPIGELYQCIREFRVAVEDGEVVACGALRLLWEDLGEVRSLAVRSDRHGAGLGQALVAALLDDARAIGLPRVIALTREVAFFERCGFGVTAREDLPRKVWTDCVRCPKRHACDEIAVVVDLVPGASAAAAARARSTVLPIPPAAPSPTSELPVIS